MIRRALRASTLCVAALPFALGGCLVAAVAVGAAAAFGVVKYTDNEAYRDFHAPPEVVWNAALGSMRELGYPVAEGISWAGGTGRIEAGDAKVSVTRESDEYTRVRARVGTFETEEHKSRAATILDRIGNRVD